MKKLYYAIYYAIINLFVRLIPVNNNRIYFDVRNECVSSTYTLLEYVKLNSDYECIINFKRENISLLNKLKRTYLLASSKVLISSYTVFKYKKNRQYMILLWHGFPTKRMRLMSNDKKTSKHYYKNNYFHKADVITSYSELSILMENARTGLPTHKYKITGSPRNDKFFESNSIDECKLFSGTNYSKIIFYLPTFRSGKYANRGNEGSYFFGDFDETGINKLEQLNRFLVESNSIFIIKPHPADEHQYKRIEKIIHDKKSTITNIKVIYNIDLNEKGVNFYSCLKYGDVFISDYSSIIFDLLLLDKPIILFNYDTEEYHKKRGVLFNFQHYLCSFYQAKDLDELILVLNKTVNFESNDLVVADRELLKKMVHRYDDGASSKRILGIINQLMD